MCEEVAAKRIVTHRLHRRSATGLRGSAAALAICDPAGDRVGVDRPSGI